MSRHLWSTVTKLGFLSPKSSIYGNITKEWKCLDLFSRLWLSMSYPRTLKSRNWCTFTSFAENKPDLALLLVSTFQRSLNSEDRNPRIRRSVLRILACIRVPVIALLILSVIKKFSLDMSSYVKKTAALFIPKLLSLDQQPEKAIFLIAT